MIPAHPYRPAADLSHFWAIVPIANPIRYQRRYELAHEFFAKLEGAGINVIRVEQAFGDRPFMVTEARNPRHVQARSVDELWVKENQIQMGMRRAKEVDPLAREMAWIDADLQPTSDMRSWMESTWHSLQHYEFVQMFESLIDLDLQGRPILPGTHGTPSMGFIANYIRAGTPNPQEVIRIDAAARKNAVHAASAYGGDSEDAHGSPKYIKSVLHGHPGGAWAASVDALNKVGGIIDYSILGAGDHYTAYALIGSLDVLAKEGSAESISSPGHTELLYAWQGRAEHWIKRDVGFVPGTILHYWHGKKAQRGYGSRWRILTENAYNPATDIKYDTQGMLQLETVTPRQIKLRDQIRAYFRSRNEDATE